VIVWAVAIAKLELEHEGPGVVQMYDARLLKVSVPFAVMVPEKVGSDVSPVKSTRQCPPVAYSR